MDIKKAYFVYNPNAGKSRAGEIARNIACELQVLCGAECVFFETINAETDAKFAKTISGQEGAVVVVLGGDGTLGAIVRTVVENSIEIPIAVYPCGTANDFATSCCIPKDVNEFAKFLVNTEPIFTDVAHVCNKTYAINAVGSGNFSNGVTTYSRKAKKFLGKFGYYIKCVCEVFKMKSCNLTFKCDDEEPFEANTLMYYLVNSERAGGFNHFAPHAEINDGKFNLIIVKKCNLFKCLKVFSNILHGKHLNNKNIIAKPVSKVVITGGEGHDKFYRCDIDGNAGPIGTLEVEILSGKVKIFTNCKPN